MDPCTHPRRLRISAKCADMCSVTFPGGHVDHGYVPHGLGLGGGDYIRLEVCIDCKVCIGLTSADDILATEAELVGERESS